MGTQSQNVPERSIVSIAGGINRRALVIATLIAVIFGLYFLRDFFGVILFAIIMAYLFTPVFHWTQRKISRIGAAASVTFLISLFIILLPLGLILFFTVIQLQSILKELESVQTLSFGEITSLITNWINNVLPGNYQINESDVTQQLERIITSALEGFLGFVKTSVDSIASLTISVVLYIYIFVNILIYKDTLITTIKRLNPIGKQATETYLHKMGATTTAMVRGQFVIALAQGFTEAVILQLAGVDHLFFFMFFLFTLLSIIPLGSGIIAIPVGIGMLLTGNIWQGALVLLGHFFIVTNIDNVLRPKLVPKHVKLNSALTMLAVFAGIGMFGFLGIVIGPVIMILILTTVQMYLDSRTADTKQTNEVS